MRRLGSLLSSENALCQPDRTLPHKHLPRAGFSGTSRWRGSASISFLGGARRHHVPHPHLAIVQDRL